MISVDEILKIILVLAISFAIAGIAYQIMRLLSKLTSMIEEARPPIKNIGTLSDYLLQDYSDIRRYVKSFAAVAANLSGILSALNRMASKKSSAKD